MDKKILFIIAAILMLVNACTKDEYHIFNSDDLIMFGPKEASDYLSDMQGALEDTVSSFTFVYTNTDIQQDTAFFNVYISGNMASKDRYYQLEQIQVEGLENAVEGVHYLAFNSEDRKDLQMMKAGKVHSRCGIILLRHQSLKTDEITLKFKLVANADFKLGSEDYLWRKITFSDKLIKPNNWTDTMSEYYFGSYSEVRHRFMIDVTKQKWDEVFIDRMINNGVELYYWLSVIKKGLIRYNELHPGEPLTDEYGDLIEFPEI